MTKLKIEIEFGNAAMQTLEEANQAIQQAIERFAKYSDGVVGGGKVQIRDINGNTVGSLVVTE